MIEEYDELSMYFGADYIVNDYIYIHQPRIGEIVQFGERQYFSTINLLTAIPSDMKSELDDIGRDYTKMTDYELFLLLAPTLTPKETSILFGDLDFSTMVCTQNINGDPILYSQSTNAIIDELAYSRIVGYLRKLHNIKPKVEKAYNETTRQILIKRDRDKKKKSNNEPYKSVLKPMISALMRYPGFKYKTIDLWSCGIFEFMDTYKGAFVYVQANATLNGYYNNIDFEKSKNNINLDWSKDL